MECCLSFTQFWTADLNTHTLSNAIEEVSSAFFYTASTHTLCQQSDKILFSCFMTTLNQAFEHKLALEDEGYKSGSERLQHANSTKKNTEDQPFVKH